jgi:hypothetical protein
MGVAAILAVIEAIGKVASAIKGIYDFVKFADDLISGRSDWDQARAIIATQVVNHKQILQVSAEILDAIAQLDRESLLNASRTSSGIRTRRSWRLTHGRETVTPISVRSP